MRTIVRNSYAPKTGEYCNTIVVDQDAGMQYIFDSDGVWTTYTSKQQEGAPMGYVDAKSATALENAKIYANEKDEDILAQAKAYTDEHSGQGGVSKEYVDSQDQDILEQAKAYTDEHSGQGGVSQQYVDQQDASILESAKDYADDKIAEIPSPNNATLTIQKNGATVQTVTANSATNKTANITVPVITVQNTDPGEGVALAANHFIAVYGIEESE
jgi:hypothetical protein